MTSASRAVLLALVLVATPALAEPTAAERETARSLLLSGRDKRRANDLKGALDDFTKAHAIMGVPTTGLELGRTQAALGQLVEARATLLDAARGPAKSGEPDAFKRARRDAKALADSLAPRLGTVTFSISGLPPAGATKVTVDGTDFAPATVAAPLKVNPGKHEIVVNVGEEEKRASIEIEEGGNKDVRMAFSGAPLPPPKPPEPPPPSAPPRTTMSPLVWIGAATAGVGIVAGSVTGILAITTYNDVKNQCPGSQCPPPTHSDIDRGKTFGTISTVSFIVAGVGAALVVVGLLTPQRETPAVQGTGDGLRVVF